MSIVSRAPHPQYNDDTVAFDFMILKLGSSAEARPVAINRDENQPKDSEQLTVIGFGATSEGGDGSTILQKVVVPTISHNLCSQQYDGEISEDVMLCAGHTEGGYDSCQGDSGGPIFELENGAPVQVGVVSFGEGCARADRAGVYARVSGVQEWIDQQICQLSSNPPSSCGPTPPTFPIEPTLAPAPATATAPASGPQLTSPVSSPVYSPTASDVHQSASPVYSPTENRNL